MTMSILIKSNLSLSNEMTVACVCVWHICCIFINKKEFRLLERAMMIRRPDFLCNVTSKEHTK